MGSLIVWDLLTKLLFVKNIPLETCICVTKIRKLLTETCVILLIILINGIISMKVHSPPPSPPPFSKQKHVVHHIASNRIPDFWIM